MNTRTCSTVWIQQNGKNQIYYHLAVKMTKMSKWEPLLCEDNGHAAIKVVVKVQIARICTVSSRGIYNTTKHSVHTDTVRQTPFDDIWKRSTALLYETERIASPCVMRACSIFFLSQRSIGECVHCSANSMLAYFHWTNFSNGWLLFVHTFALSLFRNLFQNQIAN